MFLSQNRLKAKIFLSLLKTKALKSLLLNAKKSSYDVFDVSLWSGSYSKPLLLTPWGSLKKKDQMG